MDDKKRKSLSKKTKLILLISILCLIVFAIVSALIIFSSFNSNLKTAHIAIDEAITSDALDSADSKSMPELISVMKEKSKYKVSKVEDKDGITIAYVTVQSPDLYSIAKKLDNSYDKYPSLEEMDKIITEELNNAEIISTELEVVLLKNDDGYTAILTEEFANAYYGNIMKLRKEYLKSLWEELN